VDATKEAGEPKRAEGVPPFAVWRDYSQRSGCEEAIKQFDLDFALSK
jgi:hypothetical protein